MKILELFSGTESVSKSFRQRGHQTFTVDWDTQFPSSLHCDIGKLQASEIRAVFGSPDVIFAAFDCTTFSLLAMRKHRRKNHVTGEMEPISDYAKKCDKVDKHVLSLIKELNPKVFIIENPRAGLRTMSWMQDIPRYTTSYCQYGMSYMKPTDFWSNIDLQLKPCCKPGMPCHERTSKYRPLGLLAVQSKVERSMYPQQLVEHFVDVCERAVMG